MPGLVNPRGSAGFTATTEAAAQHVGRLKDVVRSAQGIAADDAVLVQQLACKEPGCPPVETVVAVLGPPRLTWKITKPVRDISPAELRAAILTHPKGIDHVDHE
jgi:hypothetical protein